MEIFFKNVPYEMTEYDVVDMFAKVLHTKAFNEFSTSGAPLNFHVNLQINERTNRRKPAFTPGHSGRGHLTIPSLPAARHFMHLYGPGGRSTVRLRGRTINLNRSENEPPPGLISQLLNEPWEDPRHLVEEHRRETEFAQRALTISAVQFGWSCRDGTFSIEWESTKWSRLAFEHMQRQLVLKPKVWTQPAIVIQYAHISQIRLPVVGQPAILLELNVAPSFEVEPLHDILLGRPAPRTRQPYPDEHLQKSGRYISSSLRVVLKHDFELSTFRVLAEQAELKPLQMLNYKCDHRSLFSEEVLRRVESWLPTLPRPVAIQVERLLYERLMDAREMLELGSEIERLVLTHGKTNAGYILTAFAAELNALPLYMEDAQTAALAVPELLQSIADDPGKYGLHHDSRVSTAHDVLTLHVTISPSSVSITGPTHDSSNRILRQFPGFEDRFIRVAFADDDGQQYRYKADVNIEHLVRSQVLPVLRNGFKLGGRLFEYLAYSQSALKQHSFWFVRPFVDGYGVSQTPTTIRNLMGTFKEDERCPARVGARMSLAFSATKPSIVAIPIVGNTVSLANLSRSQLALVRGRKFCFSSEIADIGGKGPACMTDGAGLISIQAANILWPMINTGDERAPRPSAIQVRVAGSKGVLLVDPLLSDCRISIRRSMMKFTAGEEFREIEVCKSFTRPAVAYLNRPLIMILEARGVPRQTFLDLQQDVIDRTRASTRSLVEAAALLESNDLGASYRLPSLFRRLSKRLSNFPDVEAYLLEQGFMTRVLDYSVNHVLRGLKYRGRIQIPNAWTLVGVPDHHGILNEGEIFVCMREAKDAPLQYLTGKVVVTRSPTCHPGDVMVMTAIGRPPPGSAFVIETPVNCVLFSTKGARSPASCLGGGDYDGDEYVIIQLDRLQPPNAAAPAMYKTTPRQDVGRPYTMEDIYQFVVNFIINDQLPRIASLWLRLADISPQCVYDPNCMLLAELHSIAVDYPKTGIPVKHQEIPRTPAMIPDWSLSELGETYRDKNKVYESQRALGFLYRAISLPVADPAHEKVENRQRQARKPLKVDQAIKRLRDGNGISAKHSFARAFAQSFPVLAPGILDFSESDGASKNDDSSGSTDTDEDANSSGSEDAQRNTNQTDGREQSLNETIARIVPVLNAYCIDLRLICQHNTLARSQRAQLAEEEIVAGTIVARTPQYRRREDHMTRMNDESARLRDKVLTALAGENDSPRVRARRAWVAWRVAVADDRFGSQSFGLLALTALLDAIEDIEREAKEARRRYTNALNKN